MYQMLFEGNFPQFIDWDNFGHENELPNNPGGQPYDEQHVVDILIRNECSLMDVLKLGRFDLIRPFLERNNSIDIDEDIDDGLTALHHATLQEDVELVKLLLEYHADPNKLDNNLFTPVYYLYDKVFEVDNWDIRLEAFKALFEHGAEAVTPTPHFNRLQVAPVFVYGDENAVEYALTLDIDLLGHYDRDYNTVLHYLARNRHPNTLTKIRDKYFYVDAPNDRGETALWPACNMGVVDAVEFLLREGADVNAANRVNCTPIYTAVQNYGYNRKRYTKCIRLLIEHGADVQIVSDDNEPTLFDLLCQYGDKDLTKLIVEQLIWQEAGGTEITERTQSKIDSDNTLTRHVNFFRNLLARKVYESKTLLDFRRYSDEKLVSYSRNDDIIRAVDRCCNELKAKKLFYGSWIKKRLDKARQVAKLRDSSANILCKFMQIEYHGYSLIVDSIIRHLEERDMINLMLADPL